ncbi:MAG: flagellar biosynthesis protein FlhA [Phycisphaerae bacterium]
MSNEEQQVNSGSLAPTNSMLGKLIRHNDFIFAIGVGMVLATLLIPLPTAMMDTLLACSIAVGIGTLATVLAAKESIEFNTFPSLLLFVTLFRLSLNVASTRLILLQGDAGEIIETFGSFVAGGNLVIGLIVFLILVIIQFVVITKGAERISEVAARFNLDAMPGKQMAIDADLNAGLIGEVEAKTRREKIVKESEFFGAMDGASKFIRGDAVAGLIITGINLVGGIVMGLTKGMSAGEAAGKYSILAIGDGLVSQIPALIIATSAGFLISKSSSKTNISQDLVSQMMRHSRPLWIASFLLGAMIFVPGFPKLPFAILAIGTGLLARTLGGYEKKAAAPKEEKKKAVEKKSDEPAVEELLDVDRASIQVGARLIKLVDPRRKSSLANRISPLRRKFAQQFGIILPLIRLRDNVSLDPNTYEIRLNNHVVATGQLEPDLLLAMDPGMVQSPIDGRPAVEPVFHLPALWITPDRKEQAETAGYTVVDPETALMTHLSETLKNHADELLNRDDVQRLVDRLRESQPSLVNGVVGDLVPMGLLTRVLQGLLADQIPIRDLGQVLEALGDQAPRTKDPGILTEVARKALVRTITEQHSDQQGTVHAIVFEPTLEYELRTCLGQDGNEQMAMSPDRAMELTNQIGAGFRQAMEAGLDSTVLLCDFRIRAQLSAMLARQLPQLPVIAYDEIVNGTNIEPVTTVSLPPAQRMPGAAGQQRRASPTGVHAQAVPNA